MNTPIYLDYAATTPVAPEVADCMMQYLTADGIFANPSSIQHCFGEQVENALAIIAQYLHFKSKELLFTSELLQKIYHSNLLDLFQYHPHRQPLKA